MGISLGPLDMQSFDDIPGVKSQQKKYVEYVFENFRVYTNRVTNTKLRQPSSEIGPSPEQDWYISEIHTRCVPPENLSWTITKLKDLHPIKFN
jgi:hypothetical protein